MFAEKSNWVIKETYFAVMAWHRKGPLKKLES